MVGDGCRLYEFSEVAWDKRIVELWCLPAVEVLEFPCDENVRDDISVVDVDTCEVLKEVEEIGNEEDDGPLGYHILYVVEVYDDFVDGVDLYTVDDIESACEIDEIQADIGGNHEVHVGVEVNMDDNTDGDANVRTWAQVAGENVRVVMGELVGNTDFGVAVVENLEFAVDELADVEVEATVKERADYTVDEIEEPADVEVETTVEDNVPTIDDTPHKPTVEVEVEATEDEPAIEHADDAPTGEENVVEDFPSDGEPMVPHFDNAPHVEETVVESKVEHDGDYEFEEVHLEDFSDPEYDHEENVDEDDIDEDAFFRLIEHLDIGNDNTWDENQGNAGTTDGDGTDYDDSDDLRSIPSDSEERSSSLRARNKI